MIEQDLAGRVALVTGSTAGIGRAIAEMLGARGAAVVAHGLDVVQCDTVAADWHARGWCAVSCPADLASPQAAAELVASVCAGLGPIDILILNASVELPQVLDQVTPEAQQLQLAINFGASVALLQGCLPTFRLRGWGRVIALGSIQEERPNARHLIYAASKAALTNVILNLARHEAAPGVTFNVLRPGAILTDRNRATLADQEFHATVLSRIPLQRIGSVDDCVGLASLLCSDAGSYINGAIVSIDGGMRL